MGGLAGIALATLVSGGLTVLIVAGAMAADLVPADMAAKNLYPLNPLDLMNGGLLNKNLANIFMILLAISSFPGGCFSAFIAANSFKTTMPKVNPYLSVGIGTIVSIILAVTGLTGKVVEVFVVIGASFGPVCGAMAADYLLAGRKWAGPRAGFNPAGWISWLAGFAVGAGISYRPSRVSFRAHPSPHSWSAFCSMPCWRRSGWRADSSTCPRCHSSNRWKGSHHMIHRLTLTSVGFAVAVVSTSMAAEPTFLRRSHSDIREAAIDLSTDSADYKPMFGVGDGNLRIARSVARFGELTLDPGGGSKSVSYPSEEQIFYILEGNGILHYGDERAAVKQDDFMYLPVGMQHAISNPTASPCRLLVIGFRIPAGLPIAPTPKLMLASRRRRRVDSDPRPRIAIQTAHGQHRKQAGQAGGRACPDEPVHHGTPARDRQPAASPRPRRGDSTTFWTARGRS